MAKPTLSIKVVGAEKAIKDAKKIAPNTEKVIDQVVENTALKAVNRARGRAPVKTSALRNSIDIYEKGNMYREIASDVPYARKQEYTHATKRGFFRKSLFEARKELREDVRKALNNIAKKYG